MTKKKGVVYKIVISLLIVLSVGLIGFASFVGIKLYEYNQIPINLNAIDTTCPKFFDANNNKIISNKFSSIDIEKLSDQTKNAFVSIEDKTFYKHKGYNTKRIIKAGLENVKNKKLKEGASTITQQLAKNKYLTNEKTFSRKLKEIVIARKIEKNYSKDQILESYLNSIYFGQNCYGIESASLHYFNKPASELNLNESCFLAGLINSPTRLSQNLEEANNRKNLVLSEMLKDNKINENDYNNAIKTNITINNNQNNFLADNYLKAAVKEVSKKLNLDEDEIYKSDIEIYTNLNIDKQKMLYNELKDVVDANLCYSGVIIDNQTNAVEAFVSSENNAINIKRQAGSLIKPILVYTPAIEHNVVNEYTLINNEQTDFNGYTPKNASGVYSKQISVKDALSKSVNIPAVKILSYTGIENSKNVAKQFGLNFDESDTSLAIALGGTTYGENIIDLTNAYTTFANEGQFASANFVNKILTSNKTFIDFKTEKKQIIGSDTAFIITDMLKECATSGTAKRLNDIKGEVASKTGTVGIYNSLDNKDAYNVSYTKSKTIGVHVFTNNKMPSSINGSTTPSIVVKNVLNKLDLNDTFTIPDTIEKINVDVEELNNGKLMLSNDFMPDRYVKEIYIPKRFKPNTISQKFMTIAPPELKLSVTENSVVIEFDAIPYAKTEIYRNGKLIKTVTRSNGKQLVVDDFIPYTKTTYQAKYIVESQKNNTTIESDFSEGKSVYIEKDNLSENELETIDNYTDIFKTNKPKTTNFFKRLFKF